MKALLVLPIILLAGTGAQPAKQPKPEAKPADAKKVATIKIIVPVAEAEVLIDNKATKQKGLERIFTTPPLEDGDYSYSLRVSWLDKGKDKDAEKDKKETRVTVDRTVRFKPGAEIVVDFSKPAETPKVAAPKKSGTFQVPVTINKAEPDKGLLVFTAPDGLVRTVRVGPEAKITDEKGEALAGGLQSKQLVEGVRAMLTVDKENAKPLIRAIRLGVGKPAAVKDDRPVAGDTSHLKPLIDLKDKYQGFAGGLYPDGKNQRPPAHEAAGLALAKKIQPRDKDGKPSPDGKIVLLAIGFSNTVQAFKGFMEVAGEDKEINPKVVLVNGAKGGMSAFRIQNPDDNGPGTEYWKWVDERLNEAGVTRNQVQAIWLKETNPAPHESAFPIYIQTLQKELTRIVQVLPRRFPNSPVVYLSSRTYGGWARGVKPGRGPGNSEPYSYETAFAVKWLIEQQLKEDPALNYDPAKGDVKSPWLSWGPYLWANGTRKRSDGFAHEMSDYRADDRMHHSPAGMRKMGIALVQFFKSDATTRGWFRAPPAGESKKN